jgi:hypothetical protein
LQFRAENLWTYFENLCEHEIPGFENLFEIAKSLWKSYCNPGAITSFMAGCHFDRSFVPIGEPWRPEEDVDFKPIPAQAADSDNEDREIRGEWERKSTIAVEDGFQGDRMLARSAAFMHEALVSKEVAQAVAEGDVGRVYEGIKVSVGPSTRHFLTTTQAMLITFAGSSHSKYTGYVLDMIGFLECDADQELRTMFLQNWLVNPSGEPGRYIEKDLMQEHHNEVLEERVKVQGKSWDSRAMRDVHSRTVQHVERMKKELRLALGLFPKGWKHTKPHNRPEIKILHDVYRTTQLHKFRRGRQYQSSSSFVDEFTRGGERLETKLDKWKVALTRSDLASAIHFQGLQPLAPEEESGDGDKLVAVGGEAGDDEGDSLPVGQTEGHCIFAGGELHMVSG